MELPSSLGLRVRSALVAVSCFALASFSTAGEYSGASPLQLSTVDGSSSLHSPAATLLSVDHDTLSGSVSASLPELSSAESSSPGVLSGLGVAMRDQLVARGERLLTPSGLATALEEVQGVQGSDAVLVAGEQMAQGVIDYGLSGVEKRLLGHWVRSINLSYSPAFSGRKSLFQVDALLSLHDSDKNAFLSQLGVQSRDGEGGANVGLIWRRNVSDDLLFGVNSFYDYLSDPEVSRWSVGVETFYRSFSLSANFYDGMDEERRVERTGTVEYYSPDGWDVEIDGYLESVPWLEYSARYYSWDVIGGRDLDGSDYSVTIRPPLSLLGLSLRYDNPESGKSEFGFEGTLEYRFDIPFSEQTRPRSAVPGGRDVWQRRFERVRREYEQRVQRRAIGPVTGGPVPVPGISISASSSCVGGVCTVTITTNPSPPPGTTDVVVTMTGTAGTGNGLLRENGNCSVEGGSGFAISSEMCRYDMVAGTIVITGVSPGNYSFAVDFMNSAGVSLGRANTGMVDVSLMASIYIGTAGIQEESVIEPGGATSITVEINGVAPAGGMVIPLELAGEAAVTSDYTLSSELVVSSGPGTHELTIAAGRSQVIFLLTAVADTEDDDEETVEFRLLDGDGYTVAAAPADSAVVTISATGGVVAPIVATMYVGTVGTQTSGIAETPTAVDVTVKLSRPAPLDRAVTVNLRRSGTSSGSDYTVTGVRQVSGFISGEDPDYSVTVFPGTDESVLHFVAVDDSVDDDDETIVLSLQSGDGYIAGASSASTVTITVTDNDNPTPVASIAVAPGIITEAAASNAAMVTVTLTGIVPAGGVAVSLELSGSADIATMDDANDYAVPTELTVVDAAAGAYTLTVPAGADTTATFTLTAADDSDADTVETIVATLQEGDGYVVDTDATAEVTIVDNDSADDAGITSIPPGVITVSEGGSASYSLVLNSQPAMNQDVMIDIESDLLSVAPSPLTFTSSNWNDPQEVTVTSMVNSVTADTVATLTYTLTQAEGASDTDPRPYEGLPVPAQSVMLSNVEVPPVTDFVAAPGTEQVVLSWSNPDGFTNVRISAVDSTGVAFDLDTGNAMNDYVEPPGGSTTHTVTGMTNGTEYTFSIMVLGGDGNVSVVEEATATPSLPLLMVESADSTVDEGDMASVRVVFDGVLASAITVSYSIDMESTADTDDYELPLGATLGSFMIPAGTEGNPVSGEAPGFSVRILGDDTTEPGASETLIFTLMGGTGYELGSEVTHTVSITDTSRTLASVYIDSGPDAMAEAGETTVTVTVDLAVAGADPSLAREVMLMRDGTATLEEDYTVSAEAVPDPDDLIYTVTIDPGMMSATFELTAVDDAIDDDAESVIFTVIAGDDYDVTPGSTAMVTVPVTDNDDPLPVASIATSAATITEAAANNAATVTVTLTSTVSTTATVTVNLELSGSADIATTDATNDYAVPAELSAVSAEDGAWTIAVTISSSTTGMASFTLTAADDSDADAGETIVATLQEGDDYTVDADAAATVTIVDNDAAGVTSVPPGVITVSEGGSASYSLVLNTQPAMNQEVMIDIESSDLLLTATTPLTFTNADWDTPQTVTVDSTANSVTADTATTLTYTVTQAEGDSDTDPRPYEGLDITAQSVMVSNAATVPPVANLRASSMIMAIADGGAQVDLEWSNAARVRVSGSTASGDIDLDVGLNDYIETQSAGTSLSMTSTSNGINTATEYTFSVVALDSSGNMSEEETVTVTVGPVINFVGSEIVLPAEDEFSLLLTYAGVLPSGITINYELSGTADRTEDGLARTGSGDVSEISETQFTIDAGVDGTISTGGAVGFSPVAFYNIAADARTEGDETFIFTLLPGDGYIVGDAYPSTTLMVPDTSLSVASIYIDSAGTQEGMVKESGDGNSVTITVALAATPSIDVEVTLEGSGTADDSDYTLDGISASGDNNFTITVPADSATASFTISAARDADMDNENLVLTIAEGSGYTITSTMANAEVSLNWLDDDDTTPPMMVSGFVAAVVTAGQVELSWTNPTEPDFRMLQISGMDLTADTLVDTNGFMPGIDLMLGTSTSATDATSHTITGLTNGSMYNFSIVAMDYAGNETAPPVELERPITVGPTISFTSTTENWDESNSQQTVAVRIGIAAHTDLTVNYSISGDVDSADYGNFNGVLLTNPTATSFTLPTSVTADRTPSFLFTIIPDMTTEGSEQMIMTILPGDGYNVGSDNVRTITIGDTSVSTARLYIGTDGTQAGNILEEGATNTMVTVALDNAPSIDLTVTMARSGMADLTTDFTQTLGAAITTQDNTTYTVMIAAGESTAEFTLTAVDDEAADYNEAIVFTLQDGTNYDIASGGAEAATVTIVDNDTPARVYVGGPGVAMANRTQTGTLLEEGETSTMITVVLDNPAPTGGVTVNLQRTGNTGVTTGDFTTASLSGTDPAYTLAVAASMTEASFSLTAEDDAVIDAGETVTFTVQAGTGYRPATDNSGSTDATAIVAVTITDNDPVATISPTTATIDEMGTTSTTITVTLTPAPASGTTTVRLARTGSATIATDFMFTAAPSGTDPNYTISVGTSGMATFTLQAVDDNDVDNDEDIIFTVQPSTVTTPGAAGFYGVGTTSAATVTINSEDVRSASIELTGGATTVSEGSSATFRVTVSPAAPAGGSGIEVLITREALLATDADATLSGVTEMTISGTDYLVITIAAEMDDNTFTLTAEDDNLYEDNVTETFTFTIAPPPSSGYQYVPSATESETMATVTISDTNDVPEALIRSRNTSSTELTEAEGARRASVIVELSPVAQHQSTTLRVQFSGASVNAASSADYSIGERFVDAGSGIHTIVIAAGSSINSGITVATVVDDELYDGVGDEQFTVSLLDDDPSGSTYTKHATSDSVTFSIADDESKPEVSISRGEASRAVTLNANQTWGHTVRSSILSDDGLTITATAVDSSSRAFDCTVASGTVVTVPASGMSCTGFTFTIPAGSTSSTGGIRITTADRAVTLTLTATSSDPYTVDSSLGTFTLNINP